MKDSKKPYTATASVNLLIRNWEKAEKGYEKAKGRVSHLWLRPVANLSISDRRLTAIIGMMAISKLSKMSHTAMFVQSCLKSFLPAAIEHRMNGNGVTFWQFDIARLYMGSVAVVIGGEKSKAFICVVLLLSLPYSRQSLS